MAWQELRQALAAEVELLGRAVELGERKRQTLTANDVVALEALLPEEEQLAGELQAMEFQLTGVASQLAGKLKVSSLEDVITAADCPEPEALKQLFEQMLIRMAALKRLNQQNGLLIEQSLNFIDYSLKVIVSTPEDPAYTEGGRAKQQNNPRLIDRKL